MECRYKSSPRLHSRLLAPWPAPSFYPSLSSFFPSLADTSSSSSSTPLFGIHRRPRCCSPNHHRVLPLYRLHHLLLHYCACLFNYHYAPLPLCSTIITTTAFDCCCYCRCRCSYYYVYTISLLFADVLFILLLTPINLDYYVSIWIM